MTLSIFAAILLAALLHALWNALAKRQAAGRVSVLLVSLCSGLFSLPFLPLVRSRDRPGVRPHGPYPIRLLSCACKRVMALGRAVSLL